MATLRVPILIRTPPGDCAQRAAGLQRDHRSLEAFYEREPGRERDRVAASEVLLSAKGLARLSDALRYQWMHPNEKRQAAGRRYLLQIHSGDQITGRDAVISVV